MPDLNRQHVRSMNTILRDECIVRRKIMANPSQATGWDKQTECSGYRLAQTPATDWWGIRNKTRWRKNITGHITGPKLTIGTAAFNGPALF